MRNTTRRAGSVFPTGLHLGRKLHQLLTNANALAYLAQPRSALVVALVIFLVRAALSPNGFQRTSNAYFNYLADAFLHGQLHFRLRPANVVDLVFYADKIYLYSPPFPAFVVMPLVMLFGVSVSDVLYTAFLAAIGIGLLAKFLAVLNDQAIVLLSREQRGILVATIAFGSPILIMAPVGWISFTAQITGFVCVLLASLAALTQQGGRGYFLVGLALGCAFATRNGLLFNGIWLAYFMLKRDWHQGRNWRIKAAVSGLAPILLIGSLLCLYSLARFGNPLETGLAWHRMNPVFQADFERLGAFNLHYLPINLYYQFVAYTVLTPQQWNGGGLFWMSPVLLGAPFTVWKYHRSSLVRALVLSCVIAYIPIGLLMGTGYLLLQL